jgi:hypothetical protein
MQYESIKHLTDDFLSSGLDIRKGDRMRKAHMPMVLLFVTAFVATLAALGTAAETTKPIRLRLAYSAISVNQAIPWISYEAGHFKSTGLLVQNVQAVQNDSTN